MLLLSSPGSGQASLRAAQGHAGAIQGPTHSMLVQAACAPAAAMLRCRSSRRQPLGALAAAVGGQDAGAAKSAARASSKKGRGSSSSSGGSSSGGSSSDGSTASSSSKARQGDTASRGRSSAGSGGRSGSSKSTSKDNGTDSTGSGSSGRDSSSGRSRGGGSAGGSRRTSNAGHSSSGQGRASSSSSSSSNTRRANGDVRRAHEQTLRGAATFEQLCTRVQQQGSAMTHAGAAAAIHRLVQLAADAPQPALQQLAAQLAALMLRPGLEQCNSTQLANAAWSCGQLQGLFSNTLPAACISEMVRQQQHIRSAKDVSMALNGAAKCGVRLRPGEARQLAEVLLRPDVLASAKTQGLANSIWAAAKMGECLPEQQMQQLVAALVAKLQQAKPQELANMVWAVATMGLQLSEQQVKQLVAALLAKLQQAKPQELANMVWAVATMGLQLPEQQVEQLVAALVAKLQQAHPQAISNTVWAVATMGLQLPKQQVKQLVAALVAKLQQADPQHIANTVWAVATMGLQLPEQQVRQLMAALLGELRRLNTQDVANTVWAVATMGNRQLSGQQLEQLVAALVDKLDQAAPQAIANTMWACARLHYLPARLLSAMEPQQQLAQGLLLGMNPQGLANIAWACGELGASGSSALVGALLQQAVQLLRIQQQGGSAGRVSTSSISKFNSQDVCNLAWAAAVLDLRSYVGQVHALAHECSQQWQGMAGEALRQLHQLHLWLLDCRLHSGLLGPLTQEQLAQCKAAWDARLATAKASQLQADVLAALLRLPHAWQQPPAAEQLALDGALSIDIAAVTAGGELLAVEVDGPTHFRQPDGGLTGPTLYRNRALAARGYRVVSVPYQQWDKLSHGHEQQQYLVRLLFSGQQGAGGGGSAPAAARSGQQAAAAAEDAAPREMQRRRPAIVAPAAPAAAGSRVRQRRVRQAPE